ncbi:MAG: hypothetical protein U9O98_06145 [Asgard group archaeon]|nr:hypothetical protein [Asgard group archaeon]
MPKNKLYFEFFYVKPQATGSLFVGPKFKVIDDPEEINKLITEVHEKLEDHAIDISKIIRNQDYDNPYFYINNRLEEALDILREVDEEF